MDSPSILAGLVAPHSITEFLIDGWPDRLFVTHGSPSRLPLFLQRPELADVESLSRHYRGGPLRFTQGRRYQKMVSLDQVDAMALYRMGLTLQFEDVAPVVPGATSALRQLEHELGINPGAAKICAFASPVHDGLGVHFDAQDIISIQLRGQKRFRVAPVETLRYPYGVQYVPGTEPYDELYPQAGNGFPGIDAASLTTIDMRPGSVLYMPRGTWHSTESEGDSLSVSIGLYVPAALDTVLSQLRLLLLQDPAWRRPLYGAWGGNAAQAQAHAAAAALVADLPRQAAQLQADAVIAYVKHPSSRLAQIQSTDRFQKTPHSRLHIETPADAGSSVLRIMLWDPDYGERISVHIKQAQPHVVEVFRWCAEQLVPFTAAQMLDRFPRFDFVEHCKILRTAVEAGLLRLLWYPPLACASPPSAQKARAS